MLYSTCFYGFDSRFTNLGDLLRFKTELFAGYFSIGLSSLIADANLLLLGIFEIDGSFYKEDPFLGIDYTIFDYAGKYPN